jgi:hypothetical protein
MNVPNDNQTLWRLGERRQRRYYSLKQRMTGMNSDDIIQLRDELENHETCELFLIYLLLEDDDDNDDNNNDDDYDNDDDDDLKE